MKFLKNLLVFLIALLVVAAVVGFFLPTNYELERSIRVDASPDEIYALVGDLKRWEDWTPWKKSDPTLVVTLGEKTRGVGASQSWKGDSGEGALTFTKADPASGVAYDMSMNEGKYKSTGAVSWSKEGSGTKVTWSMQGDVPMPVLGGYFALMMDSMVGGMFEEGLETLKARAEGR